MDLTDHTGGCSDLGSNSRPSGQTKPIRRRNRMINSCLECRKRKLKCSKTSPICTNCAKTSRECLYIGSRLGEAGQMRLAEIKEKQGTLERQLERDVAKSSSAKGTLQQRILADEVEDDYDEERDLEATPLVALDMTYEDDADGGADVMIDLGVQIGKMRLTERIGGLTRPRIAEEIAAGISQHPGGQLPQPNGGQAPPFETAADGVPDTSLPDFLKPTSQYIVPTSGFFFGQIGEPPNILQFLPPRPFANHLMGQYFRAVHPIAPCSHRALTERAYTAFWDEIETGIDPRPSTQAIIFAAMFSGVVSMDEDAVYHELGGYTKANWVASLKIGTETALSKANFLRTTSVETMQAFVIYMIPLCRAEVSRAHSVLLAAAVRMAECMGLHRDGEAYGLTPLDTHVRRLIWHQLCFLDIRTCEAQGPRPVIRREDYDTKLPVNCNEDDLLLASLGTPPPEPSDAWTSNTLPLIRFEINEMMRSVWVDRRRLEMQKTTLTQVLTKIEHFRRRMSEKYDHLLTVPHPLQRYARSVMRMLTYRLYIMVLHPYYANAANPMPSRLSHLLVTSGIMVIELGMQLETNQAFKDWAWYVGAYFQYQIALLLATEIHYRPDSSEADRIWTCLDYVFGMDRKVPRETKSLQILREISQRTAIYQQKRKMRGPSSTARAPVSTNAIGGANPSKGHPPANTQQLQHQQQLQQQQHPHPHPHPHPQQPTGYPGQQTPQFRMPPGSNNDDSAQKPEQAYDTHMPGVNSGLTSAVPSQLGVVFAGVSDGHVLWSLPPMAHSPQDSDTSSLSIPGGGGTNPSTAAMAAATAAGIHCSTAAGTSAAPHDPIVVQGSIMENIDWDAMCALFPTDTRTGDLFIQGYHDGNFGIATNWSS